MEHSIERRHGEDISRPAANYQNAMVSTLTIASIHSQYGVFRHAHPA